MRPLADFRRKLARMPLAKLFAKLFVGQFLAFIVSTTGMLTTFLILNHKFHFPLLQCFCTYTLLFLASALLQVFFFRSMRTLRGPLWRTYALLAFCDANANILIVYAYQFSDMPTIQLLMCFSIPSVMLLSFLVYKAELRRSDGTRCILGENFASADGSRTKSSGLFTRTQYVAACMCIAGVAFLIITDALKSAENALALDVKRAFGNFLSISGVLLYAVSNVGCEYVLKSVAGQRHPLQLELATEEHVCEVQKPGSRGSALGNHPSTQMHILRVLNYLTNTGFFGALTCLVETIAFECTMGFLAPGRVSQRLSMLAFSWNEAICSSPVLYFFAFCSVMVLIYFLIPVLLLMSSATFLNLSLLGAQFYTLLWASIFFEYRIHTAFAVSFIFTTLGAVLYEL